ncbi:signal peptidase II [Paralcaligenes ureilyticus]|uniref:Lipoprotein signal peptidase n=1 Tax=Paralcaligenes ureilyticus TaxID=627131 RepID=A0A4R3LXG5_9BURK|nr:signal peptidase II [Paralcaligenes ureilyticus]TCT04489.1 signal peptidase II [Paralcaligenes ureilyticus]
MPESNHVDGAIAAAARRQRNRLRFWAWILGAILIVVVDQLSKGYFSAHLPYAQRWHVLPFFDFTLLHNSGAAFSFLAEGHGWQRWLFTAIALGAAGLIIHLLRRSPNQWLFCSSLMTILAGAVGNVIDRIQHGYVIDFFLFYWNSWYFPAFNVADVAITCGAILLILDEFLRWRRERSKPAKE